MTHLMLAGAGTGLYFHVMKLFDSHCHLQTDTLLSSFAEASADKPGIGNVMDRAMVAGVERMACCGTSPADWNQVLQLAKEFPQIIPMIGIHPWFVNGRDSSPRCPHNTVRPAVEPHLWKEAFQTLEKLLREHPEAGIGETGLDFQEKFTNRTEQESSFAAHLDLARELNRPAAVHCVHAWDRLIEILREHPAPKIILHAFGGAPELIPDLVKLNCWFSFCGSVLNPRAKRVRASVIAVPEDRLLVETDSPDFPPPGCSSPNGPANLIHVARAVAELRGLAVEEVASLTFLNAGQVFDAI